MVELQGLSIVIPVYNEIDAIHESILEMEEIASNIECDCEILLVNDGSTDGTEIALNNFRENPGKIRVVDHPFNKGYGAALKTGIKKSKYMHVAITDADKTYPNDRLTEFYKLAVDRDFDMVVGARVGENVKIPLIRKPAKLFINKLANYLSGTVIPDLNSGLRIMKRNVLEKFLHILPDGFSFTTTITLAMLTTGYAVHYEKIDYFHRAGSSKIRPIYDTLNFIQLIVRTSLLFNPLKVFAPLSFILFCTGASLILYRYLVGEAFGVSATVIMMAGLQVLAIGLLADLIDRRVDR